MSFMCEAAILIRMEIRVYDRSAQMKMDEVAASVCRAEILRIRFGVSSRDLAREVSKLIAGRIGLLCGRR